MFDLHELFKAPAGKPEGHHEAGALSKLFHEVQTSLSTSCTVHDSAHVAVAAPQHLPAISLFDSHLASPHQASDIRSHNASHGHPGLFTEIGNVGKELFKGVADEVVHHPLKLAFQAATGAALGLTLGFASPGLLIGAAAIGVAAAVYMGITHMRAMIHDTKVVANPDAYSASEVAQARQCVQKFGASALDTTVQVVAGAGGGLGAGLLKGVWNGSAATAATAPEAMIVSQGGTAPSALVSEVPCSVNPSAAVPSPDAPVSGPEALPQDVTVALGSEGSVSRGLASPNSSVRVQAQGWHRFANMAQNLQNVTGYLNSLRDAEEGRKFA